MKQKSIFGEGDECTSLAEEDLCKILGISAPECGSFYIV